MKTEKLAVTYRPIAALKSAPRNPRTHSEAQIRQIADSLQAFGFTNPILISQDLTIIAGHGRLEAAKLNGLKQVPTICVEGLSTAEIRAYAIADNKLAENAGWDRELLALELEHIIELDIDLDLTLTGFEAPEIDVLLVTSGAPEDDPADDLPPINPDAKAISQLGDLWQLGRHRLLCGDATDPSSFVKIMGSDRAQMIFVDPPYNVPIDGHVCGSGAIKHREFAMASGEMSKSEFTAFLKTVFGHLAKHSDDGAIHYVCMDWRHLLEVTTAGNAIYTELKNLCVWNKNNGGMGSLYRSKHELIFVFKNGTGPHINNVELGRHGRYRTNVWDYPGVNTMREGRLDDLAMHPTVKPVKLVADAILDCSDRSGIILDCFGGSGTTLIAAEETGRSARLLELDPLYTDVIVRRFKQGIGDEAIHVETGLTFNEIAEQRAETSCSPMTNGGVHNG